LTLRGQTRDGSIWEIIKDGPFTMLVVIDMKRSNT
jgi:hypothetical protein